MKFVYGSLAVLGTWILNLIFRKWFDVVVWPRIADWWSARSIRAIKRQIAKLERQLQRPQTFEDIVLRLFKLALGAVWWIAIGLTFVIASEKQIVPWARSIMDFCSLACFVIALLFAERGFSLASLATCEEPAEYDQGFRTRIEHLQQRLGAKT
jgi:hypothetical protein